MVQSIITYADLVLWIAFFLWKFVAMVAGLSYRRRWVRLLDAIAVTAMIGSSLFIHLMWDALIKPGGAMYLLLGTAVYFGLVILFTACAFLMESLYRNIRTSRIGLESASLETVRELVDAFRLNPSEAARTQALRGYALKHMGLWMTLLKIRGSGDSFRKRYRKRLIETCALVSAMLLSLAGWIGTFAGYELDQILASDPLKTGFFALLSITAFFMAASLVWAFRARAALNGACYETAKELAEGKAQIG